MVTPILFNVDTVEPELVTVSWERSDVIVAEDSSTLSIYSSCPTKLPLEDYPTLLFLHGWGVSPRSYRDLIESLARLGFHVIAPAIPGFGGSTPLTDPSDRTFERIVERFRLALEAEGLDAAVLASTICDRLKLAYPRMYGRGSQLRVCCESIAKIV